MENNFYKTLLTAIRASILLLGLMYLLPKDSVFKNKIVANKNIIVDSLMIKAIELEKDSLRNLPKGIKIIKSDSVKKAPKKLQNILKTNAQLLKFFKKLQALEKDKNAKVRIAYYGDSMNDGDLIVQDLRKLYQQKYGGKGVGFVNIYSESARTRGSIYQNFSNDWLHSSFIKRIDSRNLGVSGYTAFNDTINNLSWVSYTASNVPSKSRLYNPTLFYGKSDSAKIFIDKKGVLTPINLKGKRLLNTHKISNSALYKLKLLFDTNSTPIYGINFATANGIHIDNFSNRGNSGLGLTSLRTGLMQQFQKKLNYDLIILQFGTNVISNKSGKYGWYKKGMKRVINHLHRAFNNTDVLIFSVADKSKKYDTEMKTDSAVYRLVRAQYILAKQTNSSFINLFELMGGTDSMVEWVEEEPIMAKKDYTHFNSKGSKKIAKLIFNKLEQQYKKYKKSQPKKVIVKDSI